MQIRTRSILAPLLLGKCLYTSNYSLYLRPYPKVQSMGLSDQVIEIHVYPVHACHWHSRICSRYKDEWADITAAILIFLEVHASFYPCGLIIFRWKISQTRKFIINHILVLNTVFSRSDLLEFLENIQIIKLF